MKKEQGASRALRYYDISYIITAVYLTLPLILIQGCESDVGSEKNSISIIVVVVNVMKILLG